MISSTSLFQELIELKNIFNEDKAHFFLKHFVTEHPIIKQIREAFNNVSPYTQMFNYRDVCKMF
jgi:hypothetical protein